LVVATATLALAPSACGSDSGAGPDDGLLVVAGFYPLAHVATEVGGEHVTVVNLTNPGTEPHDLELSPRSVGSVADADLALHLSGFQPAVDDAIAHSGTPALDAADHVDLITYGSTDHDHDHDDTDHDHAPEEGSTDPHFWLDPTRLVVLAHQVAADLAALDPDNAADYRANAERLAAELEDLDEDLAAGLAECEDRTLVTSHDAFRYFAARYDLEAVSIAGLSPSHEPSPGALADLSDFLAEAEVGTVYFETLVDPAIATTLADEVGAETAVLDPVEGVTDASAGDDYSEIMRANLETVRTGQRCA
jgi:zinc transport system substrate-binding protein